MTQTFLARLWNGVLEAFGPMPDDGDEWPGKLVAPAEADEDDRDGAGPRREELPFTWPLHGHW